ncbi:metallophosphoesterase family protein [Membranihabitans marinus]|uniref:metallophosphoesterase family protein n=1 Tax=Membranihabitans marinus TaxID=1227546 RepID=UPI001F3AB420|nr:metallophosphoesterase [Membranihabitans marinus]
MKRRDFIEKTGLTAGFVLTGNQSKPKSQIRDFSINATPLETEISFKGIEKPFTVLQISDSHISCDDASDKVYEIYSSRMGRAYERVRHFQTNEETTPLRCFEETLTNAVNDKVDMLALTGDLINYPSATAVNRILAMVKETQIPFVYTAGNHDWHYEGMEGSSEELRRTWVEKSLKPLYQGSHPLYSSTVFHDVNFLCIDNSTYQISEDQLNFFKQQKKSGLPIVLFVHIPLYMPNMRICCGHPDWGWEADDSSEIERRQRWPKSGNSSSTVSFLKEVMSSKNILGVFTGHWHHTRNTSYRGIHQYFAGPNLNGQYRKISFLPKV